MRISWKWLSEMVDLSGLQGGPQGLADLLTRRGLEVEAVDVQGAGFDKVITAQILERNKHPQSDRLSLCKVTIGSGEPLQIVCGAQNMKAGDKVALAQIGADLPNGLQIKESKIRGEASFGMLCSEEELKLKDTSEGILILPASTQLGQPLAKVMGLDDTILTLKLTANRGDCMSHWGIAREVGAALGKTPKRPEAKPLPTSPASPIALKLEAGDSGPQFFGCLIEGVKIGPSPEWVVRRLEAVGSRSINNVVDATNLVLLELGQPVHAYDADLIEGSQLAIRVAKQGETLPLLDGASVTLAGTELVIGDGKKAVGLAGVMGGGNSEVRDTTKKVFLECAEFNPVQVRRAATKHLRRTDAAQRFEKGIDPSGLPHAIARLAALVREFAGGEIKGVASVQAPMRQKIARREIKLTASYFTDFLGIDLKAGEAEKILTDLGCEVAKAGDNWTVRPPAYRPDLNIREDIAEEVARSVGYDRIKETVPVLSNAPRSTWEDTSLPLIDRARDALAQTGLNETVNFAFTSQAWLSKFGMTSAAKLMNPLSEELEALTPSLLPGLIRNALSNWNNHFGSEPLPIRLFELRPTFGAAGEIKAQGETETGVKESWKLAIALSGPRYAGALKVDQAEVDFYDLKAAVEALLASLGTKGVRFAPMSESRKGPNPLFHPGQSVEVLAGSEVAGAFGLLHPGKARELKTRAPLWIAELDWTALAKLSRSPLKPPAYKTIPGFPPIERDFALLVKKDQSADKITQIALKAGKPLAKVAKIFDVYRGSEVAEGMTSVAVRVIFFDETRSIQESEAEMVSAQILAAWKKELGAELRA